MVKNPTGNLRNIPAIWAGVMVVQNMWLWECPTNDLSDMRPMPLEGITPLILPGRQGSEAHEPRDLV